MRPPALSHPPERARLPLNPLRYAPARSRASHPDAALARAPVNSHRRARAPLAALPLAAHRRRARQLRGGADARRDRRGLLLRHQHGAQGRARGLARPRRAHLRVQRLREVAGPRPRRLLAVRRLLVAGRPRAVL
eukprot:5003869-Prymnesium_polylepis.2